MLDNRGHRSLSDIARTINDASDTTSKPIYFYERYESFFAPLREEPVAIIELGVHKGESVKVFSSYFHRGTVVGVDIQDYGLDLTGYGNGHFVVGDQRDDAHLQQIADRFAPAGFDIIIDDASHYGSWSKMTFDSLYPRLKPGGLYVVEDWQPGYWDDWADGLRYQRNIVEVPKDHIPPRIPSHDAGMVGFVKSLVDEIVDRPVTVRGSHIGHPAKFDWMHINDTFAVLKKKG